MTRTGACLVEVRVMKVSVAVASALLVLLTGAAQSATPPPHRVRAFDRAVARVDALVAELNAAPGAPPGLAVVMTSVGRPPVIRTHGVLDVRTARPVEPDSLFYNASMTKAYTGLMAVVLDQRGVFDLDAELTATWPELRWPGGVDPARVTFRRWMGHGGPVTNDALEFRPAYVEELAPREVVRLLGSHTTVQAARFEYTNSGYIAYAAALEQRTGRSWKDWMREIVLEPLELDRTHPRSSSVKLDELAQGHRWTGTEWRVSPPKPDALMHAAGGLFLSPKDAARWMAANLERSPAVGDGRAFTEAQRINVTAPQNREGLACRGYALGWYICSYRSVPMLSHGGTYTGMSSLMTVSPEAGVGIAIFANSDTFPLAMGTALTRQFFDSWVGGVPLEEPQAFRTAFAESVERRISGLRRSVATRRAEPQWGGWRWSPDAGALQAYAGRYNSDGRGAMTVEVADGKLIARLGLMRLDLEPATADLFGVTYDRAVIPTPLRFERGPSGAPAALVWNDERFQKAR